MRKSLTRVQEFALLNVLQAHCKKEGDFAVYEEGWSDEKVLETVGDIYSMSSVRNIRHEFVGDLRRSRSGNPERLDVLEKRVAELEQSLGNTMVLCNRLLGWARTRGYETPQPNGSGRPISRPPAV